MKGRPYSASPPSAPPSGSPPAGAHRPDRGFCYPRGHGRVSRVVVRATALGTFGDVARAVPRSAALADSKGAATWLKRSPEPRGSAEIDPRSSPDRSHRACRAPGVMTWRYLIGALTLPYASAVDPTDYRVCARESPPQFAKYFEIEKSGNFESAQSSPCIVASLHRSRTARRAAGRPSAYQPPRHPPSSPPLSPPPPPPPSSPPLLRPRIPTLPSAPSSAPPPPPLCEHPSPPSEPRAPRSRPLASRRLQGRGPVAVRALAGRRAGD